ncbi:MAG: hypothetical protein M5R36_19810 [Deltaproteobacteria bacterium]|nr:hypothetical protein [Deltaproteobacteria bacterium]
MLLGLLIAADLLLERGTPPFVLSPPLLYAFGFRLWSARREGARIAPELTGPLVRAALLAALIAAPYYAGYLQYNLDHTLDLVGRAHAGQTRPGNYYYSDFPRLAMSTVLAAAGFAGMAVCALRKSLGPYRLFFAVSYFAACWIFSRFATKDLEYVVGALPFVAIATGVAFGALPKIPRVVPAVALVAVIAFGALLSSYLRFGTTPLLGSVGKVAAARFGLVTLRPHAAPDLRRTAERVAARLPRERSAVLFSYAEPIPQDRETVSWNLLELNAMQIYLACLRPDDVHVF